MPIRSPLFQWPAFFDERGPPDDPSILLTGTARFSGKAMQVVAVRVDPYRLRVPHKQEDAVYGCQKSDGFTAVLGVVLDELDYIAGELSDLLGKDEPSVVEFENGPYMVCMVPATFRA